MPESLESGGFPEIRIRLRQDMGFSINHHYLLKTILKNLLLRNHWCGRLNEQPDTHSLLVE
jgi:hypothetical protein